MTEKNLAGDDSSWENFCKRKGYLGRIKKEEKMEENKTNNYVSNISNANGEAWTTITTTYVNGIRQNETKSTTTNSCNMYISPVPFVTKEDFIPVKVIYNCPATICYFKDGSKEVVKVTPDEEYIPEVGVMACIMKKIFKTRNDFKRLVKSGYENQDAEVERVLHNAYITKVRQDQLAESLRAFTSKHG